MDIKNDDSRLENWFDIYDKKHLIALHNFQATNRWPKNFLPADVIVYGNSMRDIKNKIVMDWIYIQTNPLLLKNEL